MSRAKQSRRPAKQQRRRPSGGPSGAQLAAAMVDAVGPDLIDPDPLQAQLVASYLVADGIERYWEALDRSETDDGSDVPRPAISLLRLIGELRDPALRDSGLALTIALASLDRDDDVVQQAAADATKRLRFLGAKLPAWAEPIMNPELLGVWCVRDVFSDSMTIYVGARHPGVDVDHSVAARIAHGTHPELVDVFVAEGPAVLVPQVEETLANDPKASLLRLEQLSPARAGQLLWDVISGAEETMGEELEESAFDAFALLEARAALLEDAIDAASDAELAASPHATALDELDDDALVAAFRASEAYRSTDATHADVAQVVALWATSTLEGPVARISPNLELELLGDLAHAAEDDEQRALLIEHGIPTVRAWARMCAQLTELPAEAIAELERVLDEAAHDFERLVREGPRSGSPLNDRIYELMLQDGVDVGVQDELDAWSETWNALSDEQRVARMEA